MKLCKEETKKEKKNILKKKSELLKSKIEGCYNFYWAEALWLPQWEIHAIPDGKIIFNIVNTAKKMQLIRNYFDRPVIVTSWFRPEAYNELIGGAKRSAHIEGLACDFVVKGLSAQEVREALLPFLSKFEIRMENLPDASWVHCDIRQPLSEDSRYFKP